MTHSQTLSMLGVLAFGALLALGALLVGSRSPYGVGAWLDEERRSIDEAIRYLEEQGGSFSCWRSRGSGRIDAHRGIDVEAADAPAR